MFSFIYGSLISNKVEKYKKKSGVNISMLILFCVLISSVTDVFTSSKAKSASNIAFILSALVLLIVLFFLQLSKFQFLGDLNDSINQDVYSIKDSSIEKSVDLLSKQCQVNKQKSQENQKIVEKMQDENKIGFASHDIKITNNSDKINQNTQGIKMNHQNNLNNYDQIVKNQLALNDLQNQNKNIQEELNQLGSSAGSDVSSETYNELKNKITENSQGINVLKEDLNNFATKNDLDKFATMDDFNLFHGGVMNNSASIMDLKENVQSNNQGIQDNSSKIDALMNNNSNSTGSSSDTPENYDSLLDVIPTAKAGRYYNYHDRTNGGLLSQLSRNYPDALYDDTFEAANYVNGQYTNYTAKGLIAECLIRLSDFNNTKLINSINNIIDNSGFLGSVAHKHIKYLYDKNLLTSVTLKDYIEKNPYTNEYIKLAEKLKTKAADTINREYAKINTSVENPYTTSDGALFKDELLKNFATYADYFNSSVQFHTRGNEPDSAIYDSRNKLHSLNPSKSLKAQYLINYILGMDPGNPGDITVYNYFIDNPQDSSKRVHDPIRVLMNYYMGTKSDIKNDVNLLQDQFINDVKKNMSKPLNNIQNLLKTKVSTTEDFTRIDALSSISMVDGASELDLLYDIAKELKRYIKLQYSLKEIVSLDIMQSKNLQSIAAHCLSERQHYTTVLEKTIDYQTKIQNAFDNQLISETKFNELSSINTYEKKAAYQYMILYQQIHSRITAAFHKKPVSFDNFDFNAITMSDWSADFFTTFATNDILKQQIGMIKPVNDDIGVYTGERLISINDVSAFYQAQLSENIGYMKYLINKIEAVLIANKYEPKFTE